MKKATGILAALALAITLAACGGETTERSISTGDGTKTTSAESASALPSETVTLSSEEQSSEPSAEDQSESAAGTETPESESESETPASEAASAEVTIESTVLLNQDGIVITANELVDDPIWGRGIKVLVENNSDQNVTVSGKSLIVNNYMITDLFAADVAAGKKSNETIYLSSDSLEAAGIETIAEIVLSFHIYDSESFDTVFDTDEIQLKTSAYGTVEQPALDDGKELVNQNGVRIIGRYVEEDSFWGAGVLVYIENNSGQNITVSCEDMSVNGFMVTPLFSSTVNNGRMALDTITIMDSDLEENGITAVEDIELTFHVYNEDTYDTVFDTDAITFTVE